MPALPVATPTDLEITGDLVARSTNESSTGFGVVCAFPVSGQYGIGARYLYYVLVVICIFARKTKWLRNGCLAAALLFPAVAAMHSIVLAAVHVDGAVDLDIYGAFQLCTIGALAGPVTVRLSETYFSQPGRNAIFVWSSFVLAGLLSLTVEFYRASPTMCEFDAATTSRRNFNYGVEKCGLICSPEEGPFSHIRGGSADNIDVIPTPRVMTFNAGMLVAAGCSIPAILLLIGMWIKIHETGSAKTPRYDESHPTADEHNNTSMIEDLDQESQGSQNSDGGPKQKPNKIMARLQNFLEIPVFGAAILAIVIVGEQNLFSRPLQWDNEPMSNVGQWAPIAGVALALLGSLYILLAEAVARLSAEGYTGDPRTPAPTRRNSLTHAEPKLELPILSSTHNNIEFIDTIAKWWIRLKRNFRTSHDSEAPVFSDAQDAYPDIPGEMGRNGSLERMQTQWTARRSTAGSVRSGISGHVMDERSPERAGTGLTRKATLEVPSTPTYGRSSLTCEPDEIELCSRESRDLPSPETGDIGLTRKATLEVPSTPTYGKSNLTIEPDVIEPCSHESRELPSPSSPTRTRPSLSETPSSPGRASHQKRRRGPSIVIHDDG